MATTTRKIATEQDLLRMPEDGRKYELVDGKIRVSPGGARHSQIVARLSVWLHAFVTERTLGHVFESSMGYRLPDGNVRSPDVSYVRRGRFPDEKVPDGFADLVPDLAVEVVSPGDRPRHVLDKVGEYLEAGVRLVWVIDPGKGKAIAHRSPTDVAEVAGDGALDGEDVVPGFRCPLRDLLG